MKIQNIKIKDFRNIVKADINFGEINILTGKNSSGKSNFLLALTHSLSKATDYTEAFQANTVTIHRGKDYAKITTTIGAINGTVCYLLQEKQNVFCVDPKNFIFEKSIDINSLSKKHELFFTGTISESPEGSGWDNFIKNRSSISSFPSERLEKQLVYSEAFNKEIQEKDTKLVEISKSTFPHQSEYLSMFSGYGNTIFSWISKERDIHTYVTERNKSEIYEQALKRVSEKVDDKKSLSQIDFDKSKFIFLLADIEKYPDHKEKMKEELSLYTRNIVNDISISSGGSNKGEIVISSPNGPKDIWTISAGTSVILFFIVYLNWMRLSATKRSYRAPHVMIFDEVDSFVHPTLMSEFKEVLRAVSKHTQLFLSTHSPYFIDGFEKKEIYLIKDSSSQIDKKKLLNRCNIYDYQTIINLISDEEDKKIFNEKANSELFVNGFIEQIFPNTEA